MLEFEADRGRLVAHKAAQRDAFDEVYGTLRMDEVGGRVRRAHWRAVISSVDTNVIRDVLKGDPRYGASSVVALHRASSEGSLIVCAAVGEGVCAAYDDASKGAEMLDRMAMDLVPDDREVAVAASKAWRTYRQAGGTRRRFLAAADGATESTR